MFSLYNKIIIVTGGTGVLGTAFVEAIIEAKGIPIIISRNKKRGLEKVDNFSNKGATILAIAADVTQEQDLKNAKAIIIKKFGKIDGLVNAAGGNIPNAVVQNNADIFNLNIEAIKEAISINFFGSLLPTQIFGQQMAEQKNGSIINISSLSAKRALTKVLGYSIGKAAIDIYTKWMAIEIANRYGDVIRMNAITPGFFLTEQNKTLLTNEDKTLTTRGNSIRQHTPFKRFGHPEELKGALIYLLSDASKFVTGTEIIIDGGFTAFSGV